jgi:hypothetical protein
MFSIEIDISEIKDLAKNLEEAMKSSAQEAARDLSAMVHAKAVELAGERLHSRRQMYIDALSVSEEEGAFILSLDGKAGWIEDGMPRHSMLDDLLASPKAKRAADGSSYVVIPFNHGPGKGETNTPASSMDLVDTVKAELKRRKIPIGKIEKDDQGRPKIGRLHKFSINDAPLKSGTGPGQGWGPVGSVKQGPNARQAVGGGPGGGGTPFLANVAVYQHAVDGGGVKRSVMTFRIASSKHESPRWDHPGIESAAIFPSVVEWAQNTIDEEIVPKLMTSLLSKL